MSPVPQTGAAGSSHTLSPSCQLLLEATGERELTDTEPAIGTDNAANIVRAVETMELLQVSGGSTLSVCSLGLPGHELGTDAVTRWNSTVEMLGRFLEQQPASSAALLSAQGSVHLDRG